MKALITGASGGIGLDFAKELNKLGYDLILVARNKEKLNKVKSLLKGNIEIISMDLSVEKNVYKLYEMTKDKVDLLINNAGFGVFGHFTKSDLNKELNMIDLNIKAYHILTKLFLIDFVKKDKGRILNVASSAAFQPGPLFSSYYASKSYVYNLTMAIYEELRKNKSNVKIHVLCPGPVDTGFQDRANVRFTTKSIDSTYVARYTINKMLKNRLLIIPGSTMKLGVFINRLLSRKFILKIMYYIQQSKE